MRIAIVSTQNNGKTSLVNKMREVWPKYILADKFDYRQKIKDANLSINESGNLESQTIIRDTLIDQAEHYKGEPYVIHDRCVLDNLVYTLWLGEKDKIKDAEFIAKSIIICKQLMQFFDIILWLPLNPDIPLEPRENRSIDPIFREEIDNIYAGLLSSYQQSADLVFPLENSACMIELTAKTLDGKIQEIKQYLDDNGDLIETEESVLTNPEEFFFQEELLKQVKEGK